LPACHVLTDEEFCAKRALRHGAQAVVGADGGRFPGLGLDPAAVLQPAPVDASSISVETLNGTVMLSGFAKNATERTTAEGIARNVSGVKAVKNEIAVRP